MGIANTESLKVHVERLVRQQRQRGHLLKCSEKMEKPLFTYGEALQFREIIYTKFADRALVTLFSTKGAGSVIIDTEFEALRKRLKPFLKFVAT